MSRTPLCLILTVFASLIAASAARAQLVPPPDTTPVVEGKIGEKLDEYLSRLETYGFHGAALYARNDQVILRKAYGLASFSERRPNTVDTLFDVSAITRQFTVAGILRLQMQGKLRTDDPITKFFPTLGDDKAGIFLYHLMSHTSGLVYGTQGSLRARDRGEFIELARATPTQLDPGELFIMSTLNDALLAAVIEVVSGKSYEAFIREELFAPAGMKSSVFVGESLPPDVRAAMAHHGEWEMWSAEDAPSSWSWRGAGGALCSLNDLHRWEHALNTNAVLDHDATSEFFNRFIRHYASGWAARDESEKKRTVFSVTGSIQGFEAYIERCPKDGTILIVLINMTEKLSALLPNLHSILNGHGANMPPKPAPLSADQLAHLAGAYVTDDAGSLTLTAEEGALVLRDYGPIAVAVRLAERSEADIKRSPRYDSRADEAVQAWHVGDLQPLRQLFPPAREGFAQRMAYEWNALMKASGGLKRVDVLGTIPRSLNELHTYISLVSNTRTEVIKLIWYDGELADWDHIYPGIMRFIPIGDNELVSYEITNEVTPRDRAMKFVFDEDESPVRVAILIDFVRLFSTRAPG